jgi:hypothetical protein
MWWMLLLYLETGEYRAEIIYPSEIECEQNRTTVEDLCVPVEIRFPERGPAT